MSISAKPRDPTDLFVAFTWLALQGFGGVLAVVQRELVDKRRWLTEEEFLEDWAVAQVMPGPNVVNLSMMVGGRYFGLRGALAALAGMVFFPMVLVLLLAVLYAHWSDNIAVAGALRGMSAVAAGMVGGAACKLAVALRGHPLGPVLCWATVCATLLAMLVWHWPLYVVLLVIGGSACVLTWRKIAP